jgi:primosomal protein N' (replication factor Y) (superfamily II helicase)
MPYAEVAVNAPSASSGRCFSYCIPPGMDVVPGQLVRVPFGSRILEGAIVEINETPAFEHTRDLTAVIEEVPPVSPQHLQLAQWISSHYLASLFECIALMLPPGFERKSLTFLTLPDRSETLEHPDLRLNEDQEHVLATVRDMGRVGLKEIERDIGEKRAQSAISGLIRRGLLTRSYELVSARVKPKTGLVVEAARHLDERELDTVLGRSKQRRALYEFIASSTGPVSWASVRQATGCTKALLASLVARGIVSAREVTVTRDPLAGRLVNPSSPLQLTGAQRFALQEIVSSLGKRSASSAVFLLHGVTGSGKTEVYLQSLAAAVSQGKRGIVLVPEISLTPQTIERFSARFPGRVAVMHSHLTLGEQFDEWQRIEKGEFDVVVGPRSAIFTPVSNLGLVVIDEEHEWTYKQQEPAPRYHAREVAIKLAEMTGATVVLGSATPSTETFYSASRGNYRLLTLPERVTPFENTPLPEVKVVDMRNELKSGNSELFSRILSAAVTDAVNNDEQVILFLNRRGASTFVQCRKCGYVLRCRRCDISLTYHSITDTLVCHLCNYRMRAPGVCPKCGNPRIRFLGTGTQRLEEEAVAAFAPARVIRWDSDATKGKNAHERILGEFTRHEADILIGTQMITKGLDIPNVTVVGVMNADTGINLPDFRAAERTFQVLSQVAGRAGRGERGGKVFFQTYNPDHFAIESAARHDYRHFYDIEIIYRRQLSYPPFSKLASIVYSHTNDAVCRTEAARLKKELEEEREARGISELDILGPAPAYIHRLRGRYRWQIVLRGRDPSGFLSEFPLGRGWTVDIDPVGLV